MLSVSAQQEIIDELLGAYQNLEQELRRINQWDLEREFRDFNAEFVREELFTAPIDDAALGGASMLTTFRCRHRTYPCNSATLTQYFKLAETSAYGRKLSDSKDLHREIEAYYRDVRKAIRERLAARKEKLSSTILAVLLKHGIEEDTARQLLLMAQRPESLWDGRFYNLLKGYPQEQRIIKKLKTFNKDIEDLENIEKKELEAKSQQRKRLMEVINLAEIGQGYRNIISAIPVEEDVDCIMAVLKEVRFGKNAKKRFLPGQVQFVFALSAVHKELVLNLVDKGTLNNYDRLVAILRSAKWNFKGSVWDNEISKYNNRILERKIITGNILGAFANPLIKKLKPHFITFSVAPDENGISTTERGLLLPMTGENVEKLIECVSLPLGDGLKYANSTNGVYQISGIGIDFSITPSRKKADSGLTFHINVNDKDSRKFVSDSRFDSIRQYFTATPVTSVHNRDNKDAKKLLMHYATAGLTFDSQEFQAIMMLLASLRAIILIPREYLTIGEMKGYAQTRKRDESGNWPKLDWHNSSLLPPPRHKVQIRISSPIVSDANVCFVDEYPPEIILCQRTLAYQGRSFKENTIPAQIRALYFEWLEWNKQDAGQSLLSNHGIPYMVSNELHRLLVNSAKEPMICYDGAIYNILKEVVDGVQLSTVGKLLAKYRDEMLFLAPTKDVVEKFLDSCLYDTRLVKVRMSLENYLNGKTEIIMDL